MICNFCKEEIDTERFTICPYCSNPIEDNNITLELCKKDEDINKINEKIHDDLNNEKYDEFFEDKENTESNNTNYNEKSDIYIENILLLGNRSKNALKNQNIHTINELIEFLKYNDIANIKNIGKKTINEIEKLVDIFLRGEEILCENNMYDTRECIFKNLNPENEYIEIEGVIALGLSKKYVSILKNNGINTLGDLKEVSILKFNRLIGKRNNEKLFVLAKLLELPTKDVLKEFLVRNEEDRIYKFFLKRAKGETLQEIANNPEDIQCNTLTRERVRQLEKNFFEKINSFVKCILTLLKKEKNYISIQDILDIYDNDDYNMILLYCCKLLDDYEYLDFADIIIERKETGSEEDRLSDLVEDFIGDGIDLYENIEELENILNTNEFEYIGIDEFINFLNKYNYHFYGDYVVKNKPGYAILCRNIVNEYFPNGIKLNQNDNESEEELEKLRNLLLSKYGNVKLPNSDRALSSSLSRVMVSCGRGKVIPEKKIYVDVDVIKDIKKYIDKNPSNKIFYTEIFSKFQGILNATSNVNNYYFLHGVLMLYYPEEYNYKRDYLIKNDIDNLENTSLKINERIREFIIKKGRPVHKNELKQEFRGFSDIMLLYPILADPYLFKWEYNYYSCKDLLHFDENDINLLRRIIENIMNDNRGYCSDTMLYNSTLKNKCSFLEKNNIKSPMNLFYVANHLFYDEYDFRRPHICKKGIFENISVKNIALYLLNNPEEFSYQEYSKIVDKMKWSIVTSGMVLSNLEEEYYRISKDKYIKKSNFYISNQDLEQIRSVIINKLEDEILPLAVFDDFEDLPEIEYEWNEFILCTILDNMYEDIKIITPLINDRRYQKGIVTLKTSGLNSYAEVVAHVMISNNILELSESQFLSFLIIHGLSKKAIPKELSTSEYIKFENGMYKISI